MVDWDIHHGNGTQKHFYEDSRYVHTWGDAEAGFAGAAEALAELSLAVLLYIFI